MNNATGSRQMGGGGDGETDSSLNVARPIAGAAAIVAHLASTIIILTLVANVLLDRLRSPRDLIVWIAAVVTFLIAAGLSWSTLVPLPRLLAGVAFGYALIASILLMALAIGRDGDALTSVAEVSAVLAIAATAVVMAIVTARLAGQKLRRLAIPFVVVAVLLIIATTLAVVGLDLVRSTEDRLLPVLGRLLLALTASGLAAVTLLLLERKPAGQDIDSSAGASPARWRPARRRR